MSHPDLVTSRLEDEAVVATVALNGEDQFIVTPTRSLLYRAEGILSDESVSEYAHDIERIVVSTGRRKASIELSYPIEGTKSMSVPKGSLDSVLHYLLAGVLNVKEITQPGESVRAVYRFNELTVVITSERVVTNVGASVWDEDFDEYRYGDLTGLEFEEGSVATQIVLYIDGRSQRIKIPKGRAEPIKRDLREAVFEFYDVDSLAALRDEVETEEDEPEETESSVLEFDAVEPLGTGSEPDEPAETTQVTEHDRHELEAAIEQLQEAIEGQMRLLQAQREAIDDLVATLTRDR